MDRRDYERVIEHLPRARHQVLPALHAVHAVAGYLPEAAIEAVSRHTSVPNSELYGIISSYSELRLRPPHRPHVELCTGLSCRVAGADALAAAAESAAVPVEPVNCRFLCAVAPVAEVEGRYHGRLTPESFTTILSDTADAAASADAPESEPIPSATPEPTAPPVPNIRRIRVTDTVAARAVGAEAVAHTLQSLAPDIPVERSGGDGTDWALPVVTLETADGDTLRYERVTPDACTAILAGTAESDALPYAGQTRHVLSRCGLLDPESLTAALDHGAYTALDRARALPPEEVIALVQAAGLRGRGGAYFPAAVKWDSARRNPGPRYLVVNAEEGEPGVFKDRLLMESDPHLLVEGALIAAHAAGAGRVYFYINGQARLAAERVARALDQLESSGRLAPGVAYIYRGAGGYVCGEESVILNSIEGERAVPRTRPPLPTDAGLWGRPTVINNVETLSNLPSIILESFGGVGPEDTPGTKLFSLSGTVRRPGLYEAPIGVTTRQLLDLAGGPLPGREVHAAVMGGPSGGFLVPDQFDLPLTRGAVHPTGAVMGAGGVVFLDDSLPLTAAVRALVAYNADESCGKCTPCREGNDRALAILDRAGSLDALTPADREALLELCDVLQYASLCGLGQMAPGPIRSALALLAPAP